MASFPRDDLIRSFPVTVSRFAEKRSESSPDGRMLVGYPIVFNQWTEINGWEGNFLERIAPGALGRTLAQRGDRVVPAFNHGFDPEIGDKPLGAIREMTPDEYGLWTVVEPLREGVYAPIDAVVELVRMGAIWGQSFRFSVADEEINKKPEPSEANPRGLPERTINELKLYEFGPVTYPAYEATTLGVRSAEMYQLWQASRQESSDPEPDAVTLESTPDSSPEVAPVGAHRQRVEQVRRRLARAFPENKETS